MARTLTALGIKALTEGVYTDAPGLRLQITRARDGSL